MMRHRHGTTLKGRLACVMLDGMTLRENSWLASHG